MWSGNNYNNIKYIECTTYWSGGGGWRLGVDRTIPLRMMIMMLAQLSLFHVKNPKFC